MIDYKGIIEELEPEKVKELLYTLGAEQVIEKPGYFITNTICHNEESGSLKLYYYFNSHIFTCFTECGNMSIFSFLKHYYETRGYDYDWYQDIYKVILDCSNYRRPDGFAPKRYQRIRDTYAAPERVELPTYPNGIIDVFTKFYPTEWLNDGITKKIYVILHHRIKL